MTKALAPIATASFFVMAAKIPLLKTENVLRHGKKDIVESGIKLL